MPLFSLLIGSLSLLHIAIKVTPCQRCKLTPQS